MASSSRANKLDRSVWRNIWSAPIPNKVRIFGWRAAKDNLATKRNKFKRTLELDSTCRVGGHDTETSCHATIACTKSRALRSEIRKIWYL